MLDPYIAQQLGCPQQVRAPRRAKRRTAASPPPPRSPERSAAAATERLLSGHRQPHNRRNIRAIIAEDLDAFERRGAELGRAIEAAERQRCSVNARADEVLLQKDLDDISSSLRVLEKLAHRFQ